MSEISTSFCFICLLHLANEEGLSIETARFDGQEDLDVGCLGEADDVEVEHETYKRKRKSKKMGEGERKDRVVGELQALRVYKVSLRYAVKDGANLAGSYCWSSGLNGHFWNIWCVVL